MFKVRIGSRQPEVEELLRQTAGVLGCDVDIAHELVISTDDVRLAVIASALDAQHGSLTVLTAAVDRAASEPGTDPSPIDEAGDVEPVPTSESGKTVKTCRCGKAFAGRGATCGAEECKRAHAREYQKAWKAKQAEAVDTQPAETSPTGESEQDPAPAEAGPFEWPDVATWRIMTGPNTGTYLAQWELPERLADLVSAGDRLLHCEKGLYLVTLTSGGKLRLVAEPEQAACAE